MYSRRDFGKIALASFPLATAMAKIHSTIHGVEIGVQSYSFRDRPLGDAIAAMKEVGLGECELWQGHVEPKARGAELRQWRLSVPLEDFRKIRKQFDGAGIKLLAYNLSFNDSFNDEEIDRGFQMAKALGVKLITASSTLTCAKRVAPLAERYRIKVAMHGHDNTKDPNEFSTPESFASALEMSPYFAVNLDIGHFFTAGYDPVAYLEEHHSRIPVMHIKDRKKDHGPAVPFGEGETPVKQVLELLKQKKYPIPANIEYEYSGQDTVAEVKKCFQYCKDALA
jgi:sugar phosphate isomerase/epimerase